MQRKPDFVCVAPHKTGTTWLYTVLQPHPRVWLPPKKELWVLNQLDQPYLERWRLFLRRAGMPGDIRASFEVDIRSRIHREPFSRATRLAILWWAKFILLPYTLGTYRLFFPGDPTLVCGDITPNYYYLRSELVRRFGAQNPNTKIIFILRDPVERAWSYARMTACAEYQKPLKCISPETMATHLDTIQRWWKPYLSVIRVWQSSFSRVLVTYFDVLREDPLRFYREICEFLEIEESRISEKLGVIVNEGPTAMLPPTMRALLVNHYAEEVRELVDWNHSHYPARWLEGYLT